MSLLKRILLAPLGLLIMLALELYLAYERRTSRWHRQPMTAKRKDAASGFHPEALPPRATRPAFGNRT